MSNFPSIIFFSARRCQNCSSTLRFKLPSAETTRRTIKNERTVSSVISSRENRGFSGSKVPLYISSFALTAVYFCRTQFRKVQFLWKNAPVEILQIQRLVVINEIFASGCLDINSVITLRNGRYAGRFSENSRARERQQTDVTLMHNENLYIN